MKPKWLRESVMGSVFVGVFAVASNAQAVNLPPFSWKPNDVVPGEVVVGFFPDVDEAKARQIATQLGATLKKGWIKDGNYRVLKFRTDQEADVAVNQITQNSEQYLIHTTFRNLRMSIPNVVVPKGRPANAQSVQWTEEQPLHVTGDESGFQWHLRKIRENFTVPPPSAKRIAILDTGVDYTHPDLDGNVVNPGGSSLAVGSDCIDFDNDPMDEHGHGTHVAGIAAAEANGFGVHGVSPTSEILAVRVLDAFGSGSIFSIACGIDYVRNPGGNPRAQVINMSLGGFDVRGSSSYLFLQEKVDAAVSAGINVVVAAGNDDNLVQQSTGGFWRPVPADFPNSFTVGCTQEEDGRCFFSNYNTESATAGFLLGEKWEWDRVDIVAPGRRILSTLPGNTYGVLSGTSMSTPVVAGAIARVRAQVTGCDNVSCPQKRLQTFSPAQDARNGFPLKDPLDGIVQPNVARLDLDAAIEGAIRRSVTVHVYDANTHKPLKGVPVSGVLSDTTTVLDCDPLTSATTGLTDGAGTASCLVPGTAAAPSVSITAGSTPTYLGQSKTRTVDFSSAPNLNVWRRDTFDFRLVPKRPTPVAFTDGPTGGCANGTSAPCDGEISIELEWRLPEPGLFDAFYGNASFRPITCQQARGNELDAWLVLPSGEQINFANQGDLASPPFVKLIKDSLDEFRPSESIIIRDLSQGRYQFLVRQDCNFLEYGAFEPLGSSTTGAQAVVRVYRGSTLLKTSVQTLANVFGSKWWEAFFMDVSSSGAITFSPGNGRILSVDPPSVKQ
jgi:hypothetical protein